MNTVHATLLTSLLIGCASSTAPETADKSDCDVVDLGTQPTNRLPTGDVLWLPSAAGPDCDLEWSLDSGEDGALLSNDAGFFARQPGTYELTENTTGTRFSITAIDSAQLPFHNLMYLPNRSLVAVDSELWIAEGLAPRLSRVDQTSGEVLGNIPVGPWPTSLAHSEALGVVAVTQPGNDTLGLVDVDSEQLVDAIWVGDEPAVVVIDDANALAYVTLETEDAIAVVDLDAREVTGRLPAPLGPRALAISDDGTTLYVAGHRTGQPDRYPYAEAEWDTTDVMALDASSGEIIWTAEEVGNIITDIAVDSSRSSIWLTTTVSFPSRGLTELTTPPFESQVQEYDADSGSWLQQTVLQPAADGEGYILGTQGLALDGDTLWVVAQDSEVLIGLDTDTLTETARVATPGGPRSVLVTGQQAWVHSALSFEVHQLVSGAVASSVATGTDPRPEAVAAGHLHYVRPGDGYGQNFSCNSCHYDGRGDTQVWRAGPFETWELSRPMMWLEGTAPLGWGAYVNDTRTFGYTGFTSIIAKWPTSEMGEELGTFIASLTPPPKANGLTQRDGQLSAEALAGKALFDGKAGCVGCHSGPLSTNNQTFEEGITHGRVSTPTLVGAYRHRAWLKDGSAHSLEEATVAAAEWAGVTDLTDADVSSITRYLRELTDRDFFLLGHEPVATRTFLGVDEPIVLIFNQPVWTGEDNTALISVVDDAGQDVPVQLSTDGRHITLRPEAPWSHGSTYTAIIGAGLQSYDERVLSEAVEVDFVTATAPQTAFVGRYTLTVDLPAFDFEMDAPNPEVTIPMVNTFEATASTSGSTVVLELDDELTWTTEAIIAGMSFEIPAMPIRAANALAQGSAITGVAEDLDADGVIDYASGTFVVSGPGFHIEDVVWTIEPEVEAVDCAPGAEGPFTVDVSVSDTEVVIDWGEQGALGLYVTTYGADLPLGPGMVVENGDAFWTISTTEFPVGFSGPVTYGVLPEGATDDSEANGAPVGGAALESGNCYQFSVITDAFQIGSFTLTL